MAVVHRLEHKALDKDSSHTDVECTYSFFTDDEGHRYLQIDTYGSKMRKIPEKKPNQYDSRQKQSNN